MSSNESKSAQKELLRYLRFGKSVRSRNGANLVRNFILATHADPVIHRLCRTYQMSVSDLCIACTEILDEKSDSFRSEENEIPLPILQFRDPLRLDGFLRKLQRATHGQAMIQRRLAIMACARSHAEQIGAQAPEQHLVVTRSNLLKKSIFNNLLLMLLIAGLIIAGILAVLFLM